MSPHCKVSLSAAALSLLALAAANPVSAQTLVTFDDVSGNGSPLPAGCQAGTFSGPSAVYGGGSITAAWNDKPTFRNLPASASAAPEPFQTAALGFTTFGVLGLVLRVSRRTRNCLTRNA